MDLEEMIKAIQPLNGEVIPIRTIQETQPPEDFSMSFELRLSRHLQRL
jgi:tRNA-specific adenosine deaminase 3